MIPDGCVDLFVGSQGEVMIAGPATTFYDLRADKGSVLAGLRLRPGTAAAVVGRPTLSSPTGWFGSIRSSVSLGAG